MAMLYDSLLIILISFSTASAGEFLNWLMVYRTENYKRLKAEIEKQGKKLDKRKENMGELVDKSLKRKLDREEERLKANNRDLSMAKMKSMFFVGFVFTTILGMFNSIFQGRVVAKLPFTPFSMIQNLSHRNLEGDDMSDCSFIFLYILSTMSLRANIQKCLGFAPPRSADGTSLQ
jgi:uncharacterized membrane protein (DUF106 family)